MKTIIDKVFGELHYDYAWVKYDTLDLGTGEKRIKVVVEADADQGISEVQRKQYSTYLQQKNAFIRQTPKALLEYYLESYDEISESIEIPPEINKENINEQSIMKLIRINEVYFARAGHYGWLCDCAWDQEHGLCIVLSGNEPRICEQDYLI